VLIEVPDLPRDEVLHLLDDNAVLVKA
jgi:hypothetical protein